MLSCTIAAQEWWRSRRRVQERLRGFQHRRILLQGSVRYSEHMQALKLLNDLQECMS
ncbi:thaumatin-like protein 1b [Iris pallida]|uniref:Thaumatin-like protein 1b n=1 Tax=Iris pallida TaxID=29817 RepID=A0AAX6DWB1_IRIPA|nr:thaumatin-like protein 1b [Iris pallida]